MKILIIRFSSIGDIVLTTTVIRCVKKQLKGCQLHYLTKPKYEELLTGNPFIDKMHFLKDSIDETVEELREEKFDFIVDLHNNQRTLLFKRKLKVKNQSFYKQNIQKWLMVNFKINRLKKVHLVDRYMDTVLALGVKNDGEGLDYYIPINEEIDFDLFPEHHRKGFVGIVIGALHNTKKFPVPKVIELCKLIDRPIVLIGGTTDKQAADAIMKEAGDNVFNACGQFTINQSASIIKKSKVIITNDTGMMHIASAYMKRIISIWGNTIPEFGMYPYYGGHPNRSDIIEVKGLRCRPCSKLGFPKCPKKHFKCMREIEVQQIADLVNLHP